MSGRRVRGEGCEKRLFDREAGELFVSERAFEPARRFFHANGPLLREILAVRFVNFSYALLKENPDNFGVYFADPAVPVPFLWLGMGWGVDDPPGTLPSWGVSLEVNGELVSRFDEGAGGLLEACEAVAGAADDVELHRFPEHVELARWRGFEWLLDSADQRLAVERLWVGFLDFLVEAEVPERIEAFASDCGLCKNTSEDR